MKTKIQMRWEIMKEQEKEFRKDMPEFVNGIEVELFFKGLRQTEYRRGKADAENSTNANLGGKDE